MANTNEQVTSISDLITKLNSWMSSNGWTSEHLDVSTAASTGGEWAMRRLGTVNAAVTGIDGTTDVDDINEELDLTAHGFDDGEWVLYDNGGGTTITGLTQLATYFVHVIDANTISLHATREDALADTSRIGLTDTASSTSNSLTPLGMELRFAASWDSANSGVILSLYQYFQQNYVIADRPWGQDHDSGNGFAGTTPDSSLDNSRHVTLSASPIQYWAFEDDHYTHIVVETAVGEFAHFGFGYLEKLGGNWIGGEYCYGQRNNLTNFTSGVGHWDGMTFLLDGFVNDTGDVGGESDGMELFAATIHAEFMPNQPSNGMWGVSMGGKRIAPGSPQTDFGSDRQSNDGVSADVGRVLFTWGYRAGIFAQPFHRVDGTDQSGHVAFWPIAITYVDTTTGDIHGVPLAYMKDVAGISMANYTAGDEVLIGSDTWVVFPAHKRYPGTGSGVGFSSWWGIAYKKVA